VAHDPCCIGAEQIILRGRAMRSDDNEIGAGFLGDSQNFGIDTGTMRDDNVRLKVGRIGTPDQGGNPAFEIRLDQLIAERCRFGLQDGVDLAHDGEDMKPGAEGARKLDGRQQGFRQEVSSLRSMASRMVLYMGPSQERCQTDLQHTAK
jgi:hypothetical protein